MLVLEIFHRLNQGVVLLKQDTFVNIPSEPNKITVLFKNKAFSEILGNDDVNQALSEPMFKLKV